MSIPLTSSIARIYGVNKRVVGAGFLVSNTHILTCAHVVAQALNISDESLTLPTENLQLDFPLVARGLKVNAKVVCWQPVTPLSSTTPRADDEDIAVLEIEPTDDNNPRWKPTRLRVADNVWNHNFRAFGFPDQHDDGTWTDGLLKAPQANSWIQIEGKNHFGYFVAPGYSGTAVWDEELGGVVGMVVVSDKRPEMKAAFIIPTSTLLKVWPALSDSVDPTDTTDSRSAPKAPTVICGGGARTLFWTDFDPEYKAFHEADRISPAYRPDILLITVSSGIVNAMWDEFPAEVLREANIDVDVLAIQYSGATLTSKLVKGLAGKLRLLVTSTFASYRHLLFVAKDADVIVKQMLIDDADDMLRSTTHRVLHELRVTSRTRNIISISIDSPNRSGGLVKRIANAFKKHLIDYDIVGLPTPDTLDVPSTIFEEAAGESFREEPQQNGGKRSRLPKPLVANVAKRLAPFSSPRAAALARLTIFRSFAVDPQVRALFGSPGAVRENASTSKLGDSQTELLHQLTELANSAGSETLRVVTGGAGTGKSALLRRVARSLAVMWLRGTHAAALPIFVPLNQFKIDGADPNPGRVWQLLTKELAGWGNELLASNATVEERNRIALISIDEAWINDQLRRFPTTLILDGVDEFLLNNPALSLTDFAALLRFLRTEFSGNLQFLTIVGIRSSARDTSLIANSAEVLTLRGMTPSEAADIFPSAMRFIGRASDPAVQLLLLTPLVLGALDKSKIMLKPEAYLNRAALINAALTAEIESLRHSWIGTPYSTNDWINALSLLAWLQFRELQGEISDKYVATSAATAIEAWSADPDDELAADIIKSFRMLLEPGARTALLRKSIFVPVRENSYRLRHKEWGDYLVSHYAVLCIRYGHFDDLAIRALNHDIYIMAGQQFEEHDTDRSTVHALVERASSQNRFLIIGNFAQMLGATFAPITGDVLDGEILARLHLFPIVVKFAMLSALSSRMLAHDEHDNWHQFLSPVVMKTLHQHVLNEHENSLVRSLCWCFLKAMTNTDASWPGLWDTEKQNLDTLSVIATQSENGFEVDARQRSIQVAFIRIQSYALEIPTRIISTVHYLYPLVLALHRGLPLDRTVVVELPLLLSDPKVDALYRNHLVPEVAAIWNRCKDLYNEAVAR